ncbi:hypothetical protein LWI29_031243 [Acer saccharum]|uniref:RING-type E3 ubiquitin transferase n=1 Tax=Acer saccharum TaxID=4024 RepID=A0AA39VIR1_ACESA|nr:hypothetical protein LWI29_031243 [Acer saccharum]
MMGSDDVEDDIGVLMREANTTRSLEDLGQKENRYNEWRGVFGWCTDIRAIFGRSWTKRKSTSLRTVPFVLVEGGWLPSPNYAIVNMEGSEHPLPLTTVYHRLQPIEVSPLTFLQAIFGHECPVGVLDEEKVLPLGKNISAIGICNFKNGIPEIKSCEDLPYFLHPLTKFMHIHCVVLWRL